MSARPFTDGVGYPCRDANFDVLPGFMNPPQGYGEVAFYWWLGDPLIKERIEWQLDKLKDKGISGLQVNYAHSDRGGRTYGLTYPSDPPLFSETWWELFCWYLKQAKSRGMAVSLSDYTLGIAGQGWYIDEIINENPGICGATLEYKTEELDGVNEYNTVIPGNLISAIAYQIKEDVLIPGSGIDLRPCMKDNLLEWQVPEGKWQAVFVFYKADPLSIDPMNPLSGIKVIEKFFQRFEDRNPGESGDGLNFFFSDELQFGVGGNLWNDHFAEEFLKRKGYDIVPVLPALFIDIGSQTPKIRLDYSDVMVALEEERFFRPIYEWHSKRGMLYGCDHGGRGLNVVEFGDYFRTQRWMPCPGNDSPNLSADVIKNKVASSITHLYKRPRTWLEGFHSSGWGTNTAQLADAAFRNFVMGHNMLSLHGLYYSTHGGWWEWAPPCNHFRMPYWEHIGEFLKCSERLSYLLSQGVHRCDVAIMYPVEPMQAGMDGRESVGAAFGAGNYLFNNGVDFDFMDTESLARAQVRGNELHVSDEVYHVLILPAMKAVRHSTIQKALEFYQAGGIVIALNNLPEASDRIGRDDPELESMVRGIFGITAKNADKTEIHSNSAGGIGVLAQGPDQIFNFINNAFPRDFACLSDLPETARSLVLHRRIGLRDIYMVNGVPEGSECFFRAGGKVELWDPWTGKTRPLCIASQTTEGTRIVMPLGQNEAQLIVFSPGDPSLAIAESEITQPSDAITLDGQWDFELKPTLDNCWGDYRQPAFNGMISAEARRFRYAEELEKALNWQNPALDDSEWKQITYSYGLYFWKLGPFPENINLEEIEARLVNLKQADAVEISGKSYFWQPYEFSMRWGLEDDPGHQGYHGLKENVTDDFIALGKRRITWTSSVYEKEDEGSHYYLWSSVFAEHEMQARIVTGEIKPAKAWLNGVMIDQNDRTVLLKPGSNPLLLRYDQPCRTHFILESADAPENWKQTYPLATSWYNKPGMLPFDAAPQNTRHVGWYRFVSPPGLRGMTIVCRGKARAWSNGGEMSIEHAGRRDDGCQIYKATVLNPVPGTVKVAIRIKQERGYYDGAALPEPIALDCASGVLETGDWSQIDGLASYSGGAWYRKTFKLPHQEAYGQVVLNLGGVVSTAEVHINGKLAGIVVAPPWKLEISNLVNPGENHIEILVYNTLANHYLTIPTRYRGSLISGLIGPVSIEFS